MQSIITTEPGIYELPNEVLVQIFSFCLRSKQAQVCRRFRLLDDLAWHNVGIASLESTAALDNDEGYISRQLLEKMEGQDQETAKEKCKFIYKELKQELRYLGFQKQRRKWLRCHPVTYRIAQKFINFSNLLNITRYAYKILSIEQELKSIDKEAYAECPRIIQLLLQRIDFKSELYIPGYFTLKPECRVTELPREISSNFVNNFVVLELCRVRMMRIPTSFCELKHLQKIILVNNKIKCISKEIGLLTQLKELCLARNKITELPEELYQLPHLFYLNLYHNLLTTISPKIWNLPSLIFLNLQKNFLNEIPKGIQNAKNLKELLLFRNNISTLPEEILQVALTILDICYNPLADVGILHQIQLSQVDLWISSDQKSKLRAYKKTIGEGQKFLVGQIPNFSEN